MSRSLAGVQEGVGDPLEGGEPVQVLVAGRQAEHGPLPHHGRGPADRAGQPPHPQAGPQEVAQPNAVQGGLCGLALREDRTKTTFLPSCLSKLACASGCACGLSAVTVNIICECSSLTGHS